MTVTVIHIRTSHLLRFPFLFVVHLLSFFAQPLISSAMHRHPVLVTFNNSRWTPKVAYVTPAIGQVTVISSIFNHRVSR